MLTKRIPAGLFLIALTTLMLELTLIRVFDVIWYPNMAYMVITLAMFCFGFAGVYYSLRPLDPTADIRSYISTIAHLFALATFAVYPVLNHVPFDFQLFSTAPFKGFFLFLVVYFALALPFFFAGLIFTAVFSFYAKKIQSLYFWDLTGAALGCILLVPLLPHFGTGGLVLCASALALMASGLFGKSKGWLVVTLVLATIIMAIPFALYPDHYLEFRQFSNKRSLRFFKEAHKIERSYWDPISKIDIVDVNTKKFIAYDGGSQSSYIYPFNGNYSELKKLLPQHAASHFWGAMVLASHYLKQDTNQNVLIIGSAGGQETKAALVYGAGHVDAVELVGYVVREGKTDYAAYNGGIFLDPRVNAMVGEGRSFLRSNNVKYDIIQMFSNHTSSSIASGTGAMSANYLQTVEAYEDYFQKLKADGILHINHHVYPRILTTAAMAWKKLGRSNFRRHVLVFEKEHVIDNLPTVLIKMSPWTQAEVDRLIAFMGPANTVVINPIHSGGNFLPDQFFSGALDPSLAQRIAYRVDPPTDDRPFFNFFRKKIKKVEADPANFMNYSTAGLLNSQLAGGVPMDIIHLIVTGAASILFVGVFVFVPLLYSKVGRARWPNKGKTLIYFSCLGAGFIIIELIFIQMFMRIIGYPLYTYSTVVFSLLLSAGMGSFSSGKLHITPHNRWYLPFVGVIASVFMLLMIYAPVGRLLLTAPIYMRIFIAMLMIFPVGFFLGMPFPLGILSLRNRVNGAIGWAWGVNGLFTVIGGVFSVVCSLMFGFHTTLIVAVGAYFLAFILMANLRKTASLQ